MDRVHYSNEIKKLFWASRTHFQRDLLRRLSRNLGPEEYATVVNSQIQSWLDTPENTYSKSREKQRKRMEGKD